MRQTEKMVFGCINPFRTKASQIRTVLNGNQLGTRKKVDEEHGEESKIIACREAPNPILFGLTRWLEVGNGKYLFVACTS